MYRIGYVQSIDTKTLLVQVKFNNLDPVVYNVRILQQFTGKNKTFWLPDINEMVVCLMDEGGQNGIILGSIYAAGEKADSNKLPEGLTDEDKQGQVFYRAFEDGTALKYDRKNKKLTIDIRADIETTVGNDGKKPDDGESKGKVTGIYKKEVQNTFEAKTSGTFKEEATLTFEKKLTRTCKDEVVDSYEKKITGTYKDEVKSSLEKNLTIEITGNASIKVNGTVELQVKEVTLKSDSGTTINATGALTVKSAKDLTLESSGNVSIAAKAVNIN